MAKKMFRVIEVPAGATAEQLEDALNQPLEEGYYLCHHLPADGFAYRGIFKLRTQPGKD